MYKDLSFIIENYDTNDLIKNAISEVISQNIKDKNISMDSILDSLSIAIMKKIEFIIEDSECCEITSGYGSNVRGDLIDEIRRLLRTTFIE